MQTRMACTKAGHPRLGRKKQKSGSQMHAARPSIDRYSAVNGSSAISLARLIARVIIRWCEAQFPVVLLGRIFPLSETYLRIFATFL
jgi:hypothetical protein